VCAITQGGRDIASLSITSFDRVEEGGVAFSGLSGFLHVKKIVIPPRPPLSVLSLNKKGGERVLSSSTSVRSGEAGKTTRCATVTTLRECAESNEGIRVGVGGVRGREGGGGGLWKVWGV